MGEVTLLHDDNNEIYQKILFERPISRLQARKIGLLAGKHARLKKINDLYQIIMAMRHDVAIVGEAGLKEIGVPAEVYLEAGKNITDPYVNTAEAIEVLQNCSYTVVGMDIEISSRLQIYLEKYIGSQKAPIVFTSESIGLFKTSPQIVQGRHGDYYICSTKSLIDLANYLNLSVKFSPNAGIYNKIGLLNVLSTELNAHIICVENYQILCSSYTDTARATIANISNPSDTNIDYYFIAILICLLCDVSNPDIDILNRVLTAGYLLRKSLVDNSDFISNLENNIQQ